MQLLTIAMQFQVLHLFFSFYLICVFYNDCVSCVIKRNIYIYIHTKKHYRGATTRKIILLNFIMSSAVYFQNCLFLHSLLTHCL